MTAPQINTESQRFAKSCGLKSVAVYGGAPKGPQVRVARWWCPGGALVVL
jgi:superfamily II DNA/RNA helicase